MGAKTISSTQLRANLADVLDAVDKGNPFCIISRNGKQSHAIVDLDQLEDLLAASDAEYLADIAEARRQAAAGELFAFDDVFGNINAS